jgi:hypothetical protein
MNEHAASARHTRKANIVSHPKQNSLHELNIVHDPGGRPSPMNEQVACARRIRKAKL